MNALDALARASRLASRAFVAWVLVASALGLAVPGLFLPVLDHVALLLGVVMLGMGLTLEPADFRRLLERPVDVGIGAAAQWLVMPLAAFALQRVLRLPPEVAVGLILVGAAPFGCPRTGSGR